MIVPLLLAAALFYPAQTCFSKKNYDDSGTDEPNSILIFSNKSKSENDRHTIIPHGPTEEGQSRAIIIPGDRPTEYAPRSHKRKNSDEKNEILRRAYELSQLFNYYDIPRDEIDLMENKRKHYSLIPNYLSYPRYFGYKY